MESANNRVATSTTTSTSTKTIRRESTYTIHQVETHSDRPCSWLSSLCVREDGRLPLRTSSHVDPCAVGRKRPSVPVSSSSRQPHSMFRLKGSSSRSGSCSSSQKWTACKTNCLLAPACRHCFLHAPSPFWASWRLTAYRHLCACDCEYNGPETSRKSYIGADM